MAPSERFEAHSTYPYQQYNSYEPIPLSYHNPSPLRPETQYANIAYQSEAQHGQYISSSVDAEASDRGPSQMDGPNVVYCPPQQDYYVQTTANGDATDPGNDLAAVGTQFDGHIPSGYAQSF
jgi:hypothetical protein